MTLNFLVARQNLKIKTFWRFQSFPCRLYVEISLYIHALLVGCVAQLVGRRSSAGVLSLSYAQLAAEG